MAHLVLPLARPLPTSRPPTGPGGPRLVDEPGVRFALAVTALAATSLVGAAVALPAPTRLVALGVVLLLAALSLPWGAAAGTAVAAWAMWTGFAEHALGRLTTTPGDLERLGLLVGLAVLGAALHAGARGARRG